MLIATLLFLRGWLWWTLGEYVMHRWLFHARPRTLGAKHMRHHGFPRDLKLSLLLWWIWPLALVGYGTFSLLIHGWRTGSILLGGFMFGGVIYEILHYLIHHSTGTWWPLAPLRRHHLLHHESDERIRFSFTFPFWDWLLGTLKDRPAPAEPQGP